jgi:hypothetical protein
MTVIKKLRHLGMESEKSKEELRLTGDWNRAVPARPPVVEEMERNSPVFVELQFPH